MKIDINGLTNKVDILTCIKENIEAGNKNTAVDMLNQLIELEQPKATEPKVFADARDQHLIRQDLTKAIGGK